MNDTKIGLVCAFIVTRRQGLKLTQQNVADKIGMTRRTYQRKEDTGEFTLPEFEKLSNLLGIKLQIAVGFTLG